ncbi:MAG: sulfatase [bacterium]
MRLLRDACFILSLCALAGCDHSAPAPPPTATPAPLAAAVPTAAAAPVAETAGPFDVGDGARKAFLIDNDERPIINPFIEDPTLSLANLPPDPILTFSLGIADDTPGTVRFEVVLRSADGAEETIFTRDLSPPAAWTDASVALGGRSLDGKTLHLRRSLVEGGLPRYFRSAFAIPTLRSAHPVHRPSVVLVSLDTLRADRLGVAGYSAAHTPVLDQLAASGVRYTNAYSPSLWTLPSHASLLYGRFVSNIPQSLRRNDVPIPAGVPERPIAAALTDAGYRTAAFTGGGFVSQKFLFGIGFESYWCYPTPPAPKGACRPDRFDGPEVFKRAGDWLRQLPSQAPFFLFVHTYDQHDRCEFLSTAPGLAAWPPLPTDRRQALLRHYDELISSSDERLGNLLKVLDELGRTPDTLVVVLSDHGEAFSEHGERGHGCTVKPYEEVTRVPLLLRMPGRLPAGERIDTPASLIDVAPTILSLVGLPGQSGLSGPSLPGLGLPDDAGAAPVFAFCDDSLTVRVGSYKLITSRTGKFPDELYDLAADPQERANIAAANPERVAALRKETDAFWSAHGAPPTTSPAEQLDKLDPATREQLRQLGYDH